MKTKVYKIEDTLLKMFQRRNMYLKKLSKKFDYLVDQYDIPLRFQVLGDRLQAVEENANTDRLMFKQARGVKNPI